MAERGSPCPKLCGTRTAVASTVTKSRLALDQFDSARAAEGSSAATLEPVRAFMAYMALPPLADHASMFETRGVIVIEIYATYNFAGRDAVAGSERRFRNHAADFTLTEHPVEFGPARDFGVPGRRAFFVLPATSTGRSSGRPVNERGTWAFFMARDGGAWTILGYDWGVKFFGACSS